jgi:hypothetical protein
MHRESDTSSAGCGCGCVSALVSIIAGIFLLWALWKGLPTPWGKLHLDIFPPAIRLTNPSNTQPEVPASSGEI